MSKGIKIDGSGTNWTVHIEDDLLANADKKMVSECIEELLNCASKNKCLDGSVSFGAACVETVSKHNEKSGCLSSCFGCN